MWQLRWKFYCGVVPAISYIWWKGLILCLSWRVTTTPCRLCQDKDVITHARVIMLCYYMEQFWVCTYSGELLKSVGSDVSLSLPVTTKVKLGYFVTDSHKAKSALSCIASLFCCWMSLKMLVTVALFPITQFLISLSFPFYLRMRLWLHSLSCYL